MNKLPIISASLVKFGDLWDKGIHELIKEAGEKALDSAGAKSNEKINEIDALYIANEFSSNANGQSLLNSVAFEELGIRDSICISMGDASGSAAIREAANSIISGKNDIVMVLGVEKITDLKTDEVMSLTSSLISQKEESFIGATVQSQFALMAKKYLEDFKIKEQEFHFIPSNNHKNAINNEYAQYRFELPEERIKESPMSAEPIRMLDMAPYCDGAAALVMCTEKRAKSLSSDIKGCLLSSAIACDSLSLSKRKSITTIDSTVAASKEAYEMAHITPKDIGLAEVHDFAPISEILAVEDLGFAKKGQGIGFIKKNIKKLNLSGGLKACGHPLGATGVRQAIDIINRLKANKQKYGVTQTLSGTGAVSAVNIFSSD